MGIRNFLWLLFLASLWGPSFLFTMMVNNVFKPLTWLQRPSDAVAGS
jgi:hypothetical protein